jgi:L-type amino acid transporter 5
MLCIISYFFRNCLNFLTEEIRDPTKNLPRAIFISIPFITFTYMITNMAYFLVLSPDEIYATEAIALTFSSRVFSSCPWITSVFISVSTIGALSSLMLSSSRVYYAAARDGNLPQCFALISLKSFVPVTCIILQTCMACTMLLVDDLDNLILYGIFSELFFILISISSVIYFRYKRPNAIRPIKVHICFPLIFMSICIFLISLTLYQNPIETGIGILFLAGGIPLYCIGILWEEKPKWFKQFLGKFNKLLIFF